MLATVTAASKVNNPRQMFPATLMVPSFVGRPRRAGSLCPFGNCGRPDLREHALPIDGAPKFPQPLHDAGGLTDSLSPKGGPILSLGAILPLGRLRPFLQDEVRHEI